MTVRAKIARLMRPHRCDVIAEAAKVSLPTLRKLTRVDDPRTTLDIIRRVSAALGVDHGWLLDDAQDWPPVRISRPSTDLLAPRRDETRGAA